MLYILLAGTAWLHGFAHTGSDPLGLFICSLLYGVPAGLLFVKRDFESVLGDHFVVVFVRNAAAYLS